MKLAIIGGGIIGLSAAWYLKRAGADPIVFERDVPGQAASWAAAGMLSAHMEHEAGNPAFFALARAALVRWPGFADMLATATGQDPGLRLHGHLAAVFDEAAAAGWQKAVEARRRLGADLCWLSPKTMRAREPALSDEVLGGVWSPHDGQVNNRAVVGALTDLLRRLDVPVHAHTPVRALECTGNRVRAVMTERNRIPVDGVVLTAGAWSGMLEGLPLGLIPPVRPIKGQMASLAWDQAKAHVPYPQTVLWGPGIYAVPRVDGTLLLGATEEDVGFDPGLTAQGLGGLLQSVRRLLPASASLSLTAAWVGFRPKAPDGLPVLGRTEIEGLTLATGHHRNGILLAPVTAEIVTDLALGRTPRIDLSAFAPDRFGRYRGALTRAPSTVF